MNVILNMFPLKLLLLLFLLRTSLVHSGNPSVITIGIISDFADDVRQNNDKFWSFISSNFSSTVQVVPLVEGVQWWDSLQITRTVCSLFSQGVDALLSFIPPNLSPILSSYADTYGLPLITKSSAKKFQITEFNFEVKMIPSTGGAVSSLLTFYKWKSFAFLYDSDDGPQLLQEILDANIQIEVEAVWRVSNGEEAARFLQLLDSNADYQQKKEIQNVLWATNNDILDETLESMPTVLLGRSTLKFHFISAHPVLRLKKTYFPTWHLVTRLCLVDSNSTTYRTLENRWLTLQQPYGSLLQPSAHEVPENAILTYDAVGLLSKSYYGLLRQDDTPLLAPKQTEEHAVKSQCSDNPDRKPITYSHKGSAAFQNLKMTVFENGVTGKIKFDDSGERTDFGLYIFETTSVTKKVGQWSDYEGLKMSSDKTSNKEQNDEPLDKKGTDSQIKKTIRVTSVLTMPYLMLKDPTGLKGTQGNDRYKGFIKDLMDQVAEIMDIRYELIVVKDGRYGTFNGTAWNGMIGEVIREEADIAAAPLTITQNREEVVDFTKPFMSHGLNILMKKPEALAGRASGNLTPFGFLFAFGYDTWLVLAAAYVFFAVGFYAVSRFTGMPDRIRSVETKGSDQLSICSSFWFAVGSLFLQNTGIYPRSVSHRILSIVWWIFTLVAVITYIGSLSSMLIKERTKIHGATNTYISSFQLLKTFIEKGSPAIGLVSSGSTEEFFKKSEVGIYHEYGKYLEENRGVMMKSYHEGVQRVKNSNGSFAFIMESTSSEYMSNHRPCDTVSTLGYLDSRSYGFAVKKGSALRDTLDDVLLKLMESGSLRHIYEKWWHSENECSNPSLDILPGLYDGSLSIAEVSGAFFFLIIGVVAACIAAVIEYFVRSKKLSVDK